MARTRRDIPQVISAFEARIQLGQIIRRASAEKSERFIVDRRGEPMVVIMGFHDYMKTIAPEPKILARIRAHSKRVGTDRISMRSIDREIAIVRSESKKRAKTSRSA